MIVFPAIAAGNRQWHLPLANHVALGLSQAWVLGDVDSLRPWVMLDPPLVLWLSQVFGGDSVTGLTDLLHRAQSDMPRVWSAAKPPTDGDVSLSRRWPKLVRDAIAIASLAALRAGEQVREGTEVSAERAYWLGMLIDAATWLSTSGPTTVRQSEIGSILAGMGGRFVEELAAARQNKKATAEAACVAAARREYRRRGLDALRSAPGGDSALADIQETVKLWEAEVDPNIEAATSAMAAAWGPGSTTAGVMLARLAERLARARELEDAFDERLRHARLSAMAELAYGAGHEINNPLANISSRAQTLLREERDPDRRRQLATIESQAYRAYEMIADMMFFAKPPSPVPQEFRCGELVGAVRETFESLAEQLEVRLEWSISDPEATVHADLAQIQTAVRCLAVNAMEAASPGGLVELRVSCDDEAISIRVDDSGPGLTPRAREHLFDPFFSGREAGRGLGLGLSKAWAVAQGHGGAIDVESSALGGVSFAMKIPSRAFQIAHDERVRLGP